MTGPLEGVTVADFSELLPGPFMTGAMAEMGARVIKIERPGGDGMRRSSPGGFEIVNRGKSSVMLDLKNVADRERAIKIVRDADVMVEGFRPGVMARLGLGYEAMRELNPGLVYISLSGYGQTGPMVAAPGHDLNYLAQAGVTSLCGRPDGPPEHTFGLPVADLGGGLYGLASVTAALLHRMHTGVGQYIDLSITDCLAHWVNPRRGVYNVQGVDDVAGQRQIALVRPAYGVFACQDGDISVAALEDHFWAALCRAVDLGEFATPSYASLSARRGAAERINSAIAQAVAGLTRDEAMAVMARHDVPASPVLSVAEATTSAHFVARNLIVETACGPAVPFPVRLNGMRHEMPPAAELNSLGETI
ncbi:MULTISPECIES: CaiB/BaiF CoA transferase family protein [Roseobacteraceae]|uniref:Acetyl-CoA:oxalate CoA-transferase n=1 Tax=Pseudosulfitobacter pseudonitzschiae TaxID=1402135 RepID=A0A221K7P5_9RHOB|nr:MULTISPECIES: CoA transferase [Roseobacteraceae]ASM74995.1 acetyl-CoA:oxalate CoA-transferase [Pseudosulfitobacter pseudonitzschiae]